MTADAAGLRGSVGSPRWDGPLHQDVVAVGVGLEAVIVTLFVVLLVRRSRGSQEATAVKLRGGAHVGAQRGCGKRRRAYAVRP